MQVQVGSKAVLKKEVAINAYIKRYASVVVGDYKDIAQQHSVQQGI